MKHPHLALLAASLLVGLGLAPQARAQFDNYGRLVDADGTTVVIADDLSARVIDLQGGTQSSDLFADYPLTVTDLYDVAIGGDSVFLLALTAEQPTQLLCLESTWDGSTWSVPEDLSLGAAAQYAGVEIEDDYFYFSIVDEGLLHILLGQVESIGGSWLSIYVEDVGASSEFVSLAVGRAPSGANLLSAAVVCTDDGAGTRTVHSILFDHNFQVVEHGVVASGSSAEEFGADIAVDDGYIWIGTPGDDTGGTDAGKVEGWRDDGLGAYTLRVESYAEQDGARRGRVVDALDGICAVSEVRSALVAGDNEVGAVRLLRQVDADNWKESGEVYHVNNNNFSFARDYGASLVVRDVSANPDASHSIVVGAPGGTAGNGAFYPRPVFDLPMTGADLSPALPGFALGAATGSPYGATFNGAPCAIDFDNMLPGAPGFLILGFSTLNAPFKSGTLFPEPFVIKSIPVSPAGTLYLPFNWPTQPGADYTVYEQYWSRDPSAFASGGWTATAGFSFTEN